MGASTTLERVSEHADAGNVSLIATKSFGDALPAIGPAGESLEILNFFQTEAQLLAQRKAFDQLLRRRLALADRAFIKQWIKQPAAAAGARRSA